MVHRPEEGTMHDIDIRRVGNRWVRWVLLRDPDSRCRRYWNGWEWVGGLRNARLYADLRFVLKDLGRACASGDSPSRPSHWTGIVRRGKFLLPNWLLRRVGVC